MPRQFPSVKPDRRNFLRHAAGALAALSLPTLRARADEGKRLKVAAVFTEFTHRSHAHVLLENFLQPYYFNGQVTDPGCDVVSFYGDQFPAGRDMAHDVAKAYHIPIYPTVAEALCRGGAELAVDAVLSIGEHGTYPVNPKGQHEYPRKRFFDEIVAVFRRSGRAVSYIAFAQSQRKESCLSLKSGIARPVGRITATMSSKNRFRGYSRWPFELVG